MASPVTRCSFDLMVIGAGPAGMAGAVAAADAGLEVMVVDEQAHAGGQIFRQPPKSFGAASKRHAPYRWATGLIDRFEAHPRIEKSFRSTAYGVLREREIDEQEAFVGEPWLSLAVETSNGGRRLHARRILIATGAYDLPVAFPGWTLPGVMTVGAVQSLLKSQKVLAGQEVVLAGSHPLLLIAAAQLLDAGARISEIAFARGLPTPSELASAVPATWGHPDVIREAATAMVKIARHGVRVSTHTIISAATGSSSVSHVRLSHVDREWRAMGDSREIEADLVAVGYGFSPSTELARQAGCDLEWQSALGGWIVKHDEHHATSAPGIYVAGEPTGVAGAEQSRAEGTIAGLAIAASLGVAIDRATSARARRALLRTRKFADTVQRMFEPQRRALAELSRADGTVVCRCELVANEQIDQVLHDNPFISSVNAVKLECRTGMGPCQGRYCESTIAARVASTRRIPMDEVGHFSAHLPVKPVPLSSYGALISGGNPDPAISQRLSSPGRSASAGFRAAHAADEGGGASLRKE